MPKLEWWQEKPCGTSAAARRHYRRGEKPCAACRQAEKIRKAEMRRLGRAAAAR